VVAAAAGAARSPLPLSRAGTVGAVDITTVADDLVVLHDGLNTYRYPDLTPGTTYQFQQQSITTMPRPDGELLCRFATVNDMHFGEIECGRIDDHPEGPIQRVAPGEEPYPETMNKGAIREIVELEPAAVFVKGDLSRDGEADEWEAFERHYRGTFSDRLHVVRGNHDAYNYQSGYAGDEWVELPGLGVALLDTVIPGHTTGQLTAEQLEWLDAHAADGDRPVLVMGHHQQWTGSHSDNGSRGAGYFGLSPTSSDGLADVAKRRRSIIGYTAGHTHRHRVRRMSGTEEVPTIEIGCVKDFPGTWAEYRVYETGVMQVVHRISSPEALKWSERCRHLYSDFGIDYESYALGKLEDRCFTLPLR
jgi:3',5'-cyclic-AMP phosphodiesterase